jgi:hypothetical protein
VRALALLLLMSCAAHLHIDQHSTPVPINAGPTTDRRIEETCAATLGVVVTDDSRSPLAGIPVLAQIDSSESCSEERIARHTLSTEPVLTDTAGRAATCVPTKILPVDEWNGIGGCGSMRYRPRVVVGTGGRQVVKSEPFTDGMTVTLPHAAPE